MSTKFAGTTESDAGFACVLCGPAKAVERIPKSAMDSMAAIQNAGGRLCITAVTLLLRSCAGVFGDAAILHSCRIGLRFAQFRRARIMQFSLRAKRNLDRRGEGSSFRQSQSVEPLSKAILCKRFPRRIIYPYFPALQHLLPGGQRLQRLVASL
jgi:hypothetical protein